MKNPQGQMFIDWAKLQYLGVIALACLILLVASLLLGFLGPDTKTVTYDFAYKCPNESHIWNNRCVGHQLGDLNSTYYHELPPLSPLNSYWTAIVYPYSTIDEIVSATLQVSVSIFGRSGEPDSTWKLLDSAEAKNEELLCTEGVGPCWGFVLVHESSLRYEHYAINVTFPNTSTNQKVAGSIGDVAFEYQWDEAEYTKEEMTMRVFYLLYTTALIFVFWVRMRTVPISDWLFEQRSLFVLLLGLVALNNPFYPFEFLIPGGFFPLLDSLLQETHQSLLLLYWLFIFDFYRNDCEITFGKVEIIKLVLVSCYACLCFTFFAWFRLSDYIDPTFGETEHISGLVVLFFINALLFGAIIVWVLVTILLALPHVRNTRNLPRFIFATTAASVVIVSVICGLFFGVLGPVERTSPAFNYYYMLYNLYVGVLFLCYFPIKSFYGHSQPLPTEETNIFNNASEDSIYGGNSAL